MKRICTLLLSLLLLVSVLAGCGGESAAIQYLLSEEPVTLDPQVAADENAQIVITALFEGLTRLDEQHQPSPGVAERWTCSDDGKTYTFFLRQNAQWSDGTPVTAEDFRYAFQRALSPATGSTVCQSMDILQNAQKIRQGKASLQTLGVTAPDDHTLVVTLEYADPDFPALVSTTPFMPCKESYFLQTDGKYGMDAAHIVGNGPFRMENAYSWEHNDYINLVRSDSYHGENTVAPRKVTFSIAQENDAESTVQRLTDGTTDGAVIPLSQKEAAEQEGCTVALFQDTTWGLCFNTKADAVSSQSVRTRLLQTLRRDKLLEHLPDGAGPADRLLPPDTRFCGNTYREQFDVTITAQGSDADAKDKSDLPAITVLCPDAEWAKRLVNEMITDWNSATGHYYNMEPVSMAELNQRVRSGDYEAALLMLQSDGTPQSILMQFHSDSKENPAFLSEKRYDSLLDIPSNATPSVMGAQYQKAEQFLLDNSVVYPLYYETHGYAVAPKVQNVTVSFHGIVDFCHAKKQ